MDKDKLKQFEELHEEYVKKVAKEYDERNKGRYFHYDREINEECEGITWDNGGKELIESGREIISRAMILYFPEFQRLYHEIEEIRESNNFVKAPLSDVMCNLGFLVHSLQNIEEGRSSFDQYSSFELHSRMKGFSMYGGVEDIPSKFIWKLGEIVFHQVRVEEISHACGGYTHWTCRKLDEILQNMHVSYFRDKKQELGEALVREHLSVYYDLAEFYEGQPLPAMQAQDAIRRYGLTNERLITAVHEALVLQAKKYVDLASLKRKIKTVKETVKEEHDQQRKEILSKIGATPYYRS